MWFGFDCAINNWNVPMCYVDENCRECPKNADMVYLKYILLIILGRDTLPNDGVDYQPELLLAGSFGYDNVMFTYF